MLIALILYCAKWLDTGMIIQGSFYGNGHFCIEELVAVSYISTKKCFMQIVIFSCASAVPKINQSLLVSGIQICLAYCHMDRWFKLGGGPMLS